MYRLPYSEIVRLLKEKKAILASLNEEAFAPVVVIETTDIHKNQFYCNLSGAQLLALQHLQNKVEH